MFSSWWRSVMTKLQPPRRGRRSTGPRSRTRIWPRIELFEDRCLLSAGYRPIDEVGNNHANPDWGAAPADQAGGAAIQLLRNSPVAYADGINAPSLANNPSARLVSDLINNQEGSSGADLQTVDQNSLSDFGYVFGQFMDHDMDLTPTGNDSFPIPVPPGDPIGPNPLPFTRSVFDPNTGTSTANPRQQVNVNTSYLDLSQVYGSSQVVADALRTFQGGRLKTSPGNLLPFDNTDYFTPTQIAALNMANDAMAVPESQLFAAGDVRANENLELMAMQTLFMRNHNRIAAQLQNEHPSWTDEHLYQEARKLNVAEYQSIVFNDWIPAVLGPHALAPYQGYNRDVNASVATEFSTVGFRFGHSLLNNDVQREGSNGLSLNLTGGAPVELAVDFFDPKLLTPNGAIDPLTGQASTNIDPILKGDADGNAQAMDVMAIEAVRNLLFANGQLVDQDLMARDVQRARDNGIGTYNQVRVAYGLPAVTSFAQITSNVAVQHALQQAYGTVDNIDPFEGGLAENHVAGSDLGPLFQRILVDQFTRLRDGDRFFYLHEKLTPAEQRIISQGDTLAKVIEANTNVTNLQGNVFLFQTSITGRVLNQSTGRGLAGWTVQLEDTTGAVLATTVSDSQGNYRFNQFNGTSMTGLYRVREVVSPGWEQVTRNPRDILISRGGINVGAINFGNQSQGDGAAGNDSALGLALDTVTAQPLASTPLPTPVTLGSSNSESHVAGSDLSTMPVSPSTSSTSGDSGMMATTIREAVGGQELSGTDGLNPLAEGPSAVGPLG